LWLTVEWMKANKTWTLSQTKEWTKWCVIRKMHQ
jgi:hypothetical protein